MVQKSSLDEITSLERQKAWELSREMGWRSRRSYMSKVLKFNLLSTSQFYNKGYIVEFNLAKFKIKNAGTGKTLLIKRRHKNVYLVDWSAYEAEVCLVSK